MTELRQEYDRTTTGVWQNYNRSMTYIRQEYDIYTTGVWQKYDRSMTDTYNRSITFCLLPSRGRPSLCSSRLRSSATLSRTSAVSRYSNTLFVSDICSLGHQHEVHRVVGHIVACDTSSPSMHKKSRNTRERRYFWSPKRRKMSRPFKSLICCVTISTHEWYRRVLRSDRHSSVCTMVAGLEMDGIIPSSRHAKALLATVLSLLRLATAQERQ